jgi:hypothetical protein
VIENGVELAVTSATSKNETILPCPTTILFSTELAGIIALLAVAIVYGTPYGLYLAVAFAIATAALAVNVRLVLFAIDATIPTVFPAVLPIQLPTVN